MKIAAFTKTYGERRVLDFPAFDLASGRIYAVIGANGSGKSTLAKAVAGVIHSDQRKRVVNTRAIGYMPQKSFAFRRSVKENILLNGQDEARAEQLLEAMQLTALKDKPAHRLSGGETARMALARLAMKRYELLLLDEPTASMDIENTLLAEKLIVEYVQETGCALLLITHSLQEAKRIADEVLYIHQGQLLEYGEKAQILAQPKTKELARFLEFYGA